MTNNAPKSTRGKIDRNMAVGSTYCWQLRANDVTHCNIFSAGDVAEGLSGLPFLSTIVADFFLCFSRDFSGSRHQCRSDNDASPQPTARALSVARAAASAIKPRRVRLVDRWRAAGAPSRSLPPPIA